MCCDACLPILNTHGQRFGDIWKHFMSSESSTASKMFTISCVLGLFLCSSSPNVMGLRFTVSHIFLSLHTPPSPSPLSVESMFLHRQIPSGKSTSLAYLNIMGIWCYLHLSNSKIHHSACEYWEKSHVCGLVTDLKAKLCCSSCI